MSSWYTSVAIFGLETDVTLGAAGGSVVRRWLGVRSQSLELRARFKLAPSVQPGTYAWPLYLSVRPI